MSSINVDALTATGVATCQKLPAALQRLTIVGCEKAVPLAWFSLTHEVPRIARFVWRTYLDKNADGALDADTLTARVWRRWPGRAALWLATVATLAYVAKHHATTLPFRARFAGLVATNLDVVVLVLGSIVAAPRSWLVPLQAAAIAAKDAAAAAATASPATVWFALFPATAKLFGVLAPLDGLWSKVSGEGGAVETVKAVLGYGVRAAETEIAESVAEEAKDDAAAHDEPPAPEVVEPPPPDKKRPSVSAWESVSSLFGSPAKAAAPAVEEEAVGVPETKEPEPTDVVTPPTGDDESAPSFEPIPAWATLALFVAWIALGAALDATLERSVEETVEKAVKQGLVGVLKTRLGGAFRFVKFRK
mmetsp:Transcript_4543/g.18506  ORF Transcript_4543/g.18506 Transcript_4543/m.18506 type:complete len:363 (-) Transcript_4543:1162-2250(-)